VEAEEEGSASQLKESVEVSVVLPKVREKAEEEEDEEEVKDGDVEKSVNERETFLLDNEATVSRDCENKGVEEEEEGLMGDDNSEKPDSEVNGEDSCSNEKVKEEEEDEENAENEESGEVSSKGFSEVSENGFILTNSLRLERGEGGKRLEQIKRREEPCETPENRRVDQKCRKRKSQALLYCVVNPRWMLPCPNTRTRQNKCCFLWNKARFKSCFLSTSSRCFFCLSAFMKSILLCFFFYSLFSSWFLLEFFSFRVISFP
jgi:hypothetical protein